MSESELVGANTHERPEDAKSQADVVGLWLDALKLATEEEKDWREDATEAVDVYGSEDATKPGTAFNVYHANIETICPALYNSQPIPDIRRRFNDRDPVAKTGADAIERALSFTMDDYDFNANIERAVFHYALAGRGLVRIKYDPQVIADGGNEDVGYQEVTCELVPWASFRRGPGRVWGDVPWVAFAHYMTRKQLEKLTPGKAGKVTLDHRIGDRESTADDVKDDQPESDIFKRALVWEIWDKSEREVLFIAPGYKDGPLVTVKDPLGLYDFFPVPRPLLLQTAKDSLVPLCTYRIQKPILDELDTISRRITKLVKQLRPRALAPKGVDISAWATASDGDIVEVSDVMAFLESGGMDKMLAWFPMEPTIKAIESLYMHREQLKQSLFEVSGLADVMRGQSDPNEKLGTQQIKTQWGSLRVQRGQQEVQRFVRDVLRLKAEIIAEHFTPQNIAMMTGLQMDDQAMALIKDDRMRSYRIDIETDSTIRGDLTRNMEAMTQFVAGSAQYFQAIAPIVQTGGMSKVAAITIYSSFARNFKLGKDVDAVLDALVDDARKQEEMAAQMPPPPDPEMEKIKADVEATKAKAEIDMQKGQMDLQMKQEEIGLKREEMAANAEMKQMEMGMKAQEMQQKQQLTAQDMAMQMQAKQAEHSMGMQHQQMKHQMGMQQTVEQAKAKAQAMKMMPKREAKK